MSFSTISSLNSSALPQPHQQKRGVASSNVETTEKMRSVLFDESSEVVSPFKPPLQTSEVKEDESVSLFQEVQAIEEELLCHKEDKVFFLLDKFVDMILPADKRVDRKGADRVCELILETKVGLHLRAEHRDQIVSVVKNLLKEPLFFYFIKANRTASSEMEPLAQLVLGCPNTDSLSSYDIKRASLFTLFLDIRQKADEPNCYAVASLIYLLHNDPGLLFTSLITMIETGKFPLSYGDKVSVFPFVGEVTGSLPQIDEAASQPMEIGQATRYLEQEWGNQFTKKRRDFLQSILMEVLQFLENNDLSVDNNSYCGRFLSDFLSLLREHFSQSGEHDKAICSKKWFLDGVQQELQKCLLLKVGRAFQEGEKEKYVLQFYYLSSSRFMLVSTRDDFNTVMLEIVKSVVANSFYRERLNKITEEITQFLSSEELSKWLDTQIMPGSVDLIFPDQGGSASTVVSLLGKSFRRVAFSAKNGQEMVSNLHEILLKDYSENQFLIDHPQTVLALESGNHSFIFSPRKFLLSCKGNSPQELVDQGEALLQAPLAREKREEIVDAVREKLFAKIQGLEEWRSEKVQSARAFREQIKALLPENNHDVFFEQFNYFIRSISLLEFVCDGFVPTLEKMGYFLSARQLQGVRFEIEKYRLVKGDLIASHMLADILRKALMKQELEVLEVELFEKEICQYFHLPLSIDIGDTDQGDHKERKPYHLRFAVDFDFATERLQYFVKRKTSYSQSDNLEVVEGFTQFELLLPW